MTHNTSRFDDKIALITGGTSGMGLATARRLLSEGAHVIVTGRDKDRLDDAAGHLRTEFPQAEAAQRILAVRGDVANRADLDTLTDAIRTRYGRLDVLFANAGVAEFAPVADVTEEAFDRLVNINFKGVYFTVQQSLPLLSDGSAIVINASVVVHKGVPGATLYSATKGAVHNLTRTLAADLSPRRIRVNSVSPGYITTPMFHANVSLEAQPAVVATVAAGRFGAPDDIAAAVAFLSSQEASYINGQDLLIDGGMIAATPAAMH
ncbi:glucose 1-dehydrogenase [Nocardia jejuensis]|uniref:glucose 1-dehydrogenase n=1 Tax=Nocardia jejuensis TaxID=328049 RepID=UPI0008320FEF|nr:glucose 1-dehydrogenase [Nocardia jejuensis]